MITPDQPYTREEQERIEAMVARRMADPVYPISAELARELAEFRIACESADTFLKMAGAYLKKYSAKPKTSGVLPEGW